MNPFVERHQEKIAAVLHNVRLRIEVIVPDMLHDHRLGNHPSGVTCEIFEQQELP